MTKRLFCTGHIAAHRVTLHVAPGVTWQLSPATSAAALQAELDAIAAEGEALGWPMSDVEAAALLPPLCGIRGWLREYRYARNAGAPPDFAAGAADVAAYGIRYAAGLTWDEEPIEGDWRD